ncbi:FeoA domain-containing protein [Microbacterium elymi]|uniref:FeoA domain-containing protein n=1 Tax=Microbacterium elymi TaxID=2909587 RepID=A0ABY5NN84_9MICO|nr:FeoA domain-containing protein [Microbacterium elymi]UUT36584.1 FeoA domain-containing protein [Microbacterium elymi]
MLRVSDRDPQLLRAVEDAGLHIGRAVEVVGADAVRVDGADRVRLPDGVADVVWLTA